MALLVKVWGNTYLNPACIGKIEFSQKFDNGKKIRTSTTAVYDLTGQHLLLEAISEVSTECSSSTTDDAGRDNFRHEQVVQSILNEKDAELWTPKK